MKVFKAYPWRLLALAAVFAGCRSAEPVTTAPRKVTVSAPIVRDVVEWDEYTGRLESTESVEVRARVNGYLQSVHFKDAQVVKKGNLFSSSIRGRIKPKSIESPQSCSSLKRASSCPRAQIAVAWLLTKPGVGSVILGASKLSQLEDNLRAIDATLSASELPR